MQKIKIGEVREGRIISWSAMQLETETRITKVFTSVNRWKDSARSVVPRL